jgi:hypothetical protein
MPGPWSRSEPLVDLILTPSDAAVAQGDWLWELAGPNLSPQVVAAIPDALLRPELIEGNEFQCDSTGGRRYLGLHKTTVYIV